MLKVRQPKAMEILETVKEERSLSNRGITVRLTADPLGATREAREKYRNVFQALKENNWQPRIPPPAKPFFT